MTTAVHTRRRKSAPGQLVLTLTRQQRFALLRGAKFILPGSKVRSFSRVYELLEQVEIHTGVKGCRVRIGLLAEKLHCSRDTVMRTIKVAEQLGVLGVGRDRDSGNEYKRTGGNGPNWYKVFWDRVRGYCDDATRRNAERDRPAKPEPEKVTRPREDFANDRRTGATGIEWNRVRVELRGFGVANAGNATDRAWANGMSPADCLSLLAYASERPAGYWNDPAGVLYHRIVNGSPASEPSQDWPKPSPSFVLNEKRQRERERIEAEQNRQAAESRERQVAEAKRKSIEGEIGPMLDRMPIDERDELARSVFGNGPLMRIYEAKGTTAKLVRSSLIQAIRKETAKP